jgi:hypothetical protein
MEVLGRGFPSGGSAVVKKGLNYHGAWGKKHVSVVLGARSDGQTGDDAANRPYLLTQQGTRGTFGRTSLTGCRVGFQ